MPPDLSDPAREAIHATLQEHAPMGRRAVLTGWVVVTEWMDPDGDRWLSYGRAAATTSWTARGMLGEVLDGSGFEPDDDDATD